MRSRRTYPFKLRENSEERNPERNPGTAARVFTSFPETTCPSSCRTHRKNRFHSTHSRCPHSASSAYRDEDDRRRPRKGHSGPDLLACRQEAHVAETKNMGVFGMKLLADGVLYGNKRNTSGEWIQTVGQPGKVSYEDFLHYTLCARRLRGRGWHRRNRPQQRSRTRSIRGRSGGLPDGGAALAAGKTGH